MHGHGSCCDQFTQGTNYCAAWSSFCGRTFVHFEFIFAVHLDRFLSDERYQQRFRHCCARRIHNLCSIVVRVRPVQCGRRIKTKSLNLVHRHDHTCTPANRGHVHGISWYENFLIFLYLKFFKNFFTSFEKISSCTQTVADTPHIRQERLSQAKHDITGPLLMQRNVITTAFVLKANTCPCFSWAIFVRSIPGIPLLLIFASSFIAIRKSCVILIFILFPE